MKKIFYLLILTLFFLSCERFDEDVLEITGLYEANVVGISGPHTISISYDRGDEVFIEAPLDGSVWVEVRADIDDQDDFIKDIDIYEQEIGPGIWIWGDGFYNDGVLQLDYTIDFGGIDIYDFRLIGNQYL